MFTAGMPTLMIRSCDSAVVIVDITSARHTAAQNSGRRGDIGVNSGFKRQRIRRERFFDSERLFDQALFVQVAGDSFEDVTIFFEPVRPGIRADDRLLFRHQIAHPDKADFVRVQIHEP